LVFLVVSFLLVFPPISYDGLHIWRVAKNILNKQSRTADKGWYSNLEDVRGANLSSP
jgi:hypothetical protein